ncbi:hypothetical protein D3C71_1205760 [compost metagenome]
MVTLNGYESAVLIADMKFVEARIADKPAINHIRSRIRGGQPSDPETLRVSRWKRNRERREYIINFLIEHYPDKNYSEKFASYDKADLPLMMPTVESKNCAYLHEDGRHCTMKRDKTGCYTCCFVCHSPSLCAFTNCPLLPEDKIPKES